MPVDYMVVKYRRGIDVKAQVLAGRESKTIVQETWLEIEVDLNDGLNCGLFLDMRTNRVLVGKHCKNQKVLNCFAYSCFFWCSCQSPKVPGRSFNIDISRKVLERAKSTISSMV